MGRRREGCDQSGKEPPYSQPLTAHKGNLERPLRSSGKFPGKLQGPLLWRLLDGLFRPSFSLCLHTGPIMAGLGSKKPSPRAGNREVLLLSQGGPKVLAPQAQRTKSRPSEFRGSLEIISSTPSSNTETLSRAMPAQPLPVLSSAHLWRPTRAGTVLETWGHTAHSS